MRTDLGELVLLLAGSRSRSTLVGSRVGAATDRFDGPQNERRCTAAVIRNDDVKHYGRNKRYQIEETRRENERRNGGAISQALPVHQLPDQLIFRNHSVRQ